MCTFAGTKREPTEVKTVTHHENLLVNISQELQKQIHSEPCGDTFGMEIKKHIFLNYF